MLLFSPTCSVSYYYYLPLAPTIQQLLISNLGPTERSFELSSLWTTSIWKDNSLFDSHVSFPCILCIFFPLPILLYFPHLLLSVFYPLLSHSVRLGSARPGSRITTKSVTTWMLPSSLSEQICASYKPKSLFVETN